MELQLKRDRMKVFQYILPAVHVFLTVAGGIFFGVYLPEGRVRLFAFLLLFLFCALDFGYYLYFRRRFVAFSEEICRKTDQMIWNGNDRGGYACHQNVNYDDAHDCDCDYDYSRYHNQETLPSKLITELEKLEDIICNRLSESEQEKEKLQKTISEIAHQVKTPLSNIRMYQDMLGEPALTAEEAGAFTEIITGQLEKLEFLIDSLIKTSRLESDMIRLKIENGSIFQTLTAAVNDIVQKADRKRIGLSIDCDPAIEAFHDMKWTAEAIGNILDNAVKYTPEGGQIRIEVCQGELYAKISVQDTGTGIAPDHYNDIFKRFYREDTVRNREGLGLGLYIARNIVTREGGYIMVRSVPGEGSVFSLFLPVNDIL